MFLSIGVFRILHDNHCEVWILVKCIIFSFTFNLFISLVLKQVFVKVTKSSSVSPFKQKAYILFSSFMLHSEMQIWRPMSTQFSVTQWSIDRILSLVAKKLNWIERFNKTFRENTFIVNFIRNIPLRPRGKRYGKFSKNFKNLTRQ